ncbi:hypothetical protein DSO57_1004329, partial [Entomophthora muscae]
MTFEKYLSLIAHNHIVLLFFPPAQKYFEIVYIPDIELTFLLFQGFWYHTKAAINNALSAAFYRSTVSNNSFGTSACCSQTHGHEEAANKHLPIVPSTQYSKHFTNTTEDDATRPLVAQNTETFTSNHPTLDLEYFHPHHLDLPPGHSRGQILTIVKEIPSTSPLA